MEFEEYRLRHLKNWQNKILRICRDGTILVAAVELIVFFCFLKFHLLKSNPKHYFILRFIIPTSINIFTCVLTSKFINNEKFSSKSKNYIVSFATLVCCTVVATFHSYYEFLLMSLVFPLFLCTVFADKKLLRRVFLFTMPSFLFSAVVIFFEKSENNFVAKLMTLFCLFMMILLCFFLARGLVKSQCDQMAHIYAGYRKQLSLINELKIEPFTHLYNKTALEGCMNAYIRKYEEGVFNPTVALMDIDHFKNVNDTYGHDRGDDVLLSLAKIITEKMDGIRHAFRFGGEEFVVVFEKENSEFVYDKIQSIKDAFKATDFDFAEGIHFSFSAGIAPIKKGWDRKQWFNAVDGALYKAKFTGRDKIVMLDSNNENSFML